jgi:LmbE family N-acetylglucosaminyl deacetylase
VLGVTDLTFLGYRDSGMVGTSDNENPAAFMNIPSQEVVPRLVALIRRLKPQVIVTFDPSGAYGHPDHIAIHHHTIAAFHAAANPTQFPELGEAWQTARLLYSVLPLSLFHDMYQHMVASGVDTTEFKEMLESGLGWPDDNVHFKLDVSSWVEAKWEALLCHRTQFGPDALFRRIPEADIKRLISLEYYVQAWPEPDNNLCLSDIFAGLSTAHLPLK